jgi:hypothetical protein
MAGVLLPENASAQNRRNSVNRGGQRVVVVRPVGRPYRGWGYRGWRSPFWGYSSFYDPYWNSPYLRYQDEKFRLQRELAGNRRELQKHNEKYRADGYISPKEREELADDHRDVQRSIEKLNNFTRNY